jgi:hypothetical protein
VTISLTVKAARPILKVGAVVTRKAKPMHLNENVNPTSEHALYLRLFITNGGGW